jgi:hypothetical protein
MGHLLAAPSAPEVLLDNQFFEHSQVEHDFYTIGHRVMLLNASGRSFAADPARIEDIAERRRAEQERELLLGELDHRVKNLFAVIRALAAQGTPRGWTRLRPLTTFCSSATGAALTWARLPTRCKSSQELQKPSRSSDVRQGRAPLPALEEGGGTSQYPPQDGTLEPDSSNARLAGRGSRSRFGRVLIVEDDLIIAVEMEYLLKGLGCTVLDPVARISPRSARWRASHRILRCSTSTWMASG